MYTEDELLPISALQHLLFCPRQCALIHLEQAWSENALTAGGRVLHDKVHNAEDEICGDVFVARGLRLRSLSLGLTGIADVVEFHPVQGGEEPGGATPPGAVALPGRAGLWRPYPVEYKRGRKKFGDCDNVQLCAQAMCLEEMLSCQIPAAALFYGKTRRRTVVPLGEPLRRITAQASASLHELIAAGRTPPGQYSAKCDSCSIFDQCMPKQTATPAASAYIKKALAEIRKS